jgi:hypothetical protein
MGSASINPGVSDLLQTLSSLNSPVLSSSKVVSALEKASPGDIVKLSMEATQLEGVDAMFGIPDGSSAAAIPHSASTVSSASASSTTSLTTQLANYEAALQSDETQALLGDGASATGSLFDLTG